MISQMQKDSNAISEGIEAPATQAASFPDTKASFAAWLDVLKPGPAPQPDGNGAGYPAVDEGTADFVVEFGEGSDCQIVFTGILDLGGSLSGSLRSDSGSLITRPGRIDADIDVAGKATIDSTVNGNINATGRVVLNSNAKVLGNISAPALSVKRGAIFEGDCVFLGSLDEEAQPASEVSEAPGFYSASAV